MWINPRYLGTFEWKDGLLVAFVVLIQGGGEESSIINSMTQHKLEHGGQLLTVNRLISFSTTSVDLISLFANRLL